MLCLPRSIRHSSGHRAQLARQLSCCAAAVQDMLLDTQHQVLEDAVEAHPNLRDAIILLKVSSLPQESCPRLKPLVFWVSSLLEVWTPVMTPPLVLGMTI